MMNDLDPKSPSQPSYIISVPDNMQSETSPQKQNNQSRNPVPILDLKSLQRPENNV